MNKNIWLVVSLFSVSSSTISVVAYNFFIQKELKNLKERIEQPVRQANFSTIVADPPRSLYYTAMPTHFTEAAALVTPTVVNIRANQSGSRSSLDDFWHSQGVSSGSGVIISSDGYIVTNHHVVENSGSITVSTYDNKSYEAQLVGTDPSTDLALIKIEVATAMPYLSFADSDSARVGEWVLAVGNPFNLTSTVTAGIISAKGRNINILEGAYKIESFIQTDAAVNPGNSGGALVNTNGNLIGINTAIITETGHYEGYSFAVPANLVRKVVEDLRDFGAVQRGFLGVSIRDVDEEIAARLKLKTVSGVYVSQINQGSAAQVAGLKEGDVILSINDIKTPTTPELQEQVARYRPGDVIIVAFVRNNQEQNIQITLRDKDNEVKLTKKIDFALLRSLGIEVRELLDEEKRSMKTNGVMVTSIRKESKIDRTNMNPNFVITKINKTKVTTVQALIEAIEASPTKRVMLEGIYLDKAGTYYYAFVK